MAANQQKLLLSQKLNQTAIDRAMDQVRATGRSLPCSVVKVAGSMITVRFEVLSAPFTLPQVTVPLATSIYYLIPVQTGDTGVVVPADAHLNQVAGLSGGTPDLTQPGNLAALHFHPLGRADWPASPNANARVVQGPQGVILRTMDGSCAMTLNQQGIVIKFAGVTYTFNAAGLTVTGGEVDADGIGLKTHKHISAGSGSATGAPIAGAGP